MQVQIIRYHFHTDKAVVIQILVHTNVRVNVVARVIYEEMELEVRWATSQRIAMAGKRCGNKE